MVKRVFILLVLAAIILIGILAMNYLGPYAGFKNEAFVTVTRGMSSRAIADQLAKEGVVRSPWAFLTARALSRHARLQAGEYRFESDATPFEVLERLRRGDVYFEQLTVPEGSNLFDIAALLDNGDVMEGADFIKAASDSKTIQDLDPLAPSLEGFLFPSTYRMTRDTTAAQLCRMMTAEFRKQWRSVIAGSNAPESVLHQAVTLGSMIEKETGVSGERALVAAVFQNRLQKNMLLQCDPTIVYGLLLEHRYRGKIYKSDLSDQSRYNTYTHAGLPPGPICNPGITSLKAAVHPADTGYLYFVAKANGSGGHQFSTSLSEHTKAVDAYRKAVSQQ